MSDFSLNLSHKQVLYLYWLLKQDNYPDDCQVIFDSLQKYLFQTLTVNEIEDLDKLFIKKKDPCEK